MPEFGSVSDRRLAGQVHRAVVDLVGRVREPASRHHGPLGPDLGVRVHDQGAVGPLDQLVELLDPGRLELHRGDEARREDVDLAVEAHEPVGEEVVIGPGRAEGPLVALAGDLVLVLAEDDVPLEVDLHRLIGVLDQLAVGPADLLALLGVRVAPDHGALGLDVHDPLLRRPGDDVHAAAVDHHAGAVGLLGEELDIDLAAASRKDAGHALGAGRDRGRREERRLAEPVAARSGRSGGAGSSSAAPGKGCDLGHVVRVDQVRHLDLAGPVDRRQVDFGDVAVRRERRREGSPARRTAPGPSRHLRLGLGERLIFQSRALDLGISPGQGRLGNGLERGRSRQGRGGRGSPHGCPAISGRRRLDGLRRRERRGLGHGESGPLHDHEPARRLLELRQAGRLVGAEPHLASGPQRRAALAARRGLLTGDPDVALGVDVGLEALAPVHRELDDPDDGARGTEALGSLKHGGLAGEHNPPLAIGFPRQHAARSQVDRVGKACSAGTVLILGP